MSFAASGAITLTRMWQLDKSGLTSTRVMDVSFSMRRIAKAMRDRLADDLANLAGDAAPCGATQAAPSALPSENFNIEIDHGRPGVPADFIRDSLERALHESRVVGDHRHSQGGRLPAIEIVDLRDRHVVPVAEPVFQAFDDSPFILER